MVAVKKLKKIFKKILIIKIYVANVLGKIANDVNFNFEGDERYQFVIPHPSNREGVADTVFQFDTDVEAKYSKTIRRQFCLYDHDVYENEDKTISILTKSGTLNMVFYSNNSDSVFPIKSKEPLKEKEDFINYFSTLILGTLTSCGSVDTPKNLENSEKTSTQDTTSAKNTTLFDEEECHPLPILMFFNEIGDVLKLDEAVNLHDEAFAKYLEENNYENYFLQDKNDFMDLLKNLNGIYLLIMNEKPDYIDYAFEYESLTIIYETPVKITFKIKCSKNSAKEDFDKIKSDENAILTYVHEADGFRIYNLKYKDKTYEDKEIFVADLGGYYATFLIFEKK